MNARLIALVLALHTLAAAWFCFAPLDLPSAKALRLPDERWQLDDEARTDTDEALSAITAGHLFTAAAGPASPGLPALEEKPLTPPNWRIAGVYASGGQQVALMAVEGEPLPRALHVGDRLPGGAKILRIGPDRLCISLNGKTRSLITYQE